MTSENIELSALSHPIKSVTVFKSSKAEVNRSFSLDLKVLYHYIVTRILTHYLPNTGRFKQDTN